MIKKKTKQQLEKIAERDRAISKATIKQIEREITKNIERQTSKETGQPISHKAAQRIAKRKTRETIQAIIMKQYLNHLTRMISKGIDTETALIETNKIIKKKYEWINPQDYQEKISENEVDP